MAKKAKGNLNTIRKQIQRIQLILIIVITILFSVGGILINVNASEKALDQNLQNTAELITRLYNFTKDMNSEDLCSYMDSIVSDLPDVDVISIVNTKNLRVYHTNHGLINTIYNGTHPDFESHIQGFYTENDIGPSGAQRRTYSAIYDENGAYSGFIMTIMLKTSIQTVTMRIITLFLAVTIAGILIEIAICGTFSRKIKQKLLGYEPDAFTSMFKIRENILESIYDGIVAVDKFKSLQFANKSALKILKCENEDEKINIIRENVFIDKFIKETVENGEPKVGMQEETEDGTALLVDCLPIKEEGEINGAVAILHDRTEYTKLIEELAGTKYLVDSMRANNHDFTNKLHVILGLIQIGEYDKAVSYIENISLIQRETLSTVMKAVDNPSFAALLIGKIARASECNVKFVLKEGVRFKGSEVDVPSEALVTIVGNLIDNALDSMNIKSLYEENAVRELIFGAFTKPGELLITVQDTGDGIAEEDKASVFEKGFSTKGTGRGIGLYHTKQLVESLGGSISFESQRGAGTCFMVRLYSRRNDG